MTIFVYCRNESLALKAVADKTAVDRQTAKGTPRKLPFNLGTALHDLAEDYTDGNPFFATLGGTGDAAIAAGWFYPPTHNLAESAREAASVLYNVPTAIDPDYWKKTGEQHRETLKNIFTVTEEQRKLLQDERNRAISDFISTFLKPKGPYADY